MFRFGILACLLSVAFATPAHVRPGIYGDKFQGDIKLTEEQEKILFGHAPKVGWIPVTHRWPINLQGYVVVPYRMQASEGFTQAQINFMLDEFRIIESSTCIRFVERTNQIDFVDITNTLGCWSFVGRVGGRQEMSMSAESGCFREGVAVHEMLHVLGFMHTQSRVDRDDYIEILWDNIWPGAEGNFLKVDPAFFENFNTPYDLRSVMHYPRWAFQNDWSVDTIVPRDRSYIDIIGASQISAGDITRLLRMYQCVNH